jgi:uncharacterized SAM-binding protein YcdF (DUF218 family)
LRATGRLLRDPAHDQARSPLTMTARAQRAASGMTASVSAHYLLSQLLLPPVSLILAALVGILLASRWRRSGLLFAATCLIALLALSTTMVAQWLAHLLEPPPLSAADRSAAQAIVILAGGRVHAAPEWGGDTVNAATLRRTRYGAQLARETGLPVLLAGGDPEHVEIAEARLMQPVLEREFGIRARWVEDRSNTTGESARFTAAILLPEGITRVLLVTDAFHMPRAQRAFTRAGLTPIPAPTGFVGNRSFGLRHLVPNATAMQLSYLTLHEWAAGLWYRLRDD